MRRRRNAHSAKIEVFTPQEFSSITSSAQAIETQPSASLSYNYFNPSAHSYGGSSPNEQLGYVHAGHQATGIAPTGQPGRYVVHNQGSISTHGSSQPFQSDFSDPPHSRSTTSTGGGVSAVSTIIYGNMDLYVVTALKPTCTLKCSRYRTVKCSASTK